MTGTLRVLVEPQEHWADGPDGWPSESRSQTCGDDGSGKHSGYDSSHIFGCRVSHLRTVGGIARGPRDPSGPIAFDKYGVGKLQATTQLQSFSLFLTAEPCSAERQPSEMLVLENETRKNTRGKIFVVTNYQLMKRTQYQ
jgi:hypothetical protein